METVPLTPERFAQLKEYAQRHGQDPAAALDEALAAYLSWEKQDFAEAVDSVGRGYEDLRAGRSRPAAKFLDGLRRKNGIPR